jgi:hypothetical protein
VTTSDLYARLDSLEKIRCEGMASSSLDVHLAIEASQLPQLVEQLKSTSFADCRLHLAIKVEDGQVPDGRLVKDLQRSGVVEVQAEFALDISQPERTVRELHFLKQCAEHYVHVDWTLLSDRPVDPAPLVHMLPPKRLACEEKATAKWQSFWVEHQTNEGLTYRKGPGFVIVRDQRAPFEGQLFSIEEPLELGLFWRTMEPITVQELKQIVPMDRMQVMIDHHLLFRVGDHVLNLATHANKKIIPYL